MTATDQALRDREKTDSRVIAALDQASDMVVLFDPEDRIVFSNSAWREFNSDVAWATKPGATYEQFIHALTNHGLVPDAIGREEEWIAWRLERHRNPRGPFETPTRKDKWISINEQVLEDGSTILVIRDVTERIRAEQLIRTQNERFNVALENIPGGICVYDKHHRLVVSNSNFAEMYGVAPNQLKPGMTMKEVMEQRITLGIYAGETPEQYIHDRLKWVTRRKPGFKTETLNDGRTVQITQQPLEDGGWLSIHEDVSERVRAEKALRQSEAQLRAVLDNSPFCVNLKDRKGRYLFANQEYKDWWGQKGEMIGKTLEQVSPEPQRAANVRNREEEVLKTGSPLVEEVTLQRPRDGKTRDRLRIKFPVKVQDGSVVGIGTIAIDITDRKQAERAQKKSEELFLKAFHANPTPLSIADAEGRFHDVNDAWLRTFTLERDQVIGCKSDELCLWNRLEDRLRFIELLRDTGALNGFEAQFRTKSGKLIDVMISADLVNVNGESRIFSNLIDVTEDKKSKQLLVEHRDELQQKVNEATADIKRKARKLETALAREKELNELQRQFVSMASHEFRTPLAIIDQAAQRLLRKTDKDTLTTEDTRSRITKIRNAVIRMTRLMESTLTTARMDEGRVTIDVAPCEIRRTLVDACARQQEISSTHVIACDVNDLPETIKADSTALDQMLSNLLSNAVKYSPNEPRIEVRGKTVAENIFISVTDHGLGIDEDDILNLFTRFFRAKSSLGIAGTGIGLHLIKFLVEMHDGSIEVESCKGEGSTFTIRLPIAGPKILVSDSKDGTAA
jgi:PAS domain S-box-containing protein